MTIYRIEGDAHDRSYPASEDDASGYWRVDHPALGEVFVRRERLEVVQPPEPESGAFSLGAGILAIRTNAHDPAEVREWCLSEVVEPHPGLWQHWPVLVAIARANGLDSPVPLLTTAQCLNVILADAPSLPLTEQCASASTDELEVGWSELDELVFFKAADVPYLKQDQVRRVWLALGRHLREAGGIS